MKRKFGFNDVCRPFQDATQGDSVYTITIMDCLQAIKKARELGLFNFQDFNFEEYDRLEKIQGGDLNWIVPGKESRYIFFCFEFLHHLKKGHQLLSISLYLLK